MKTRLRLAGFAVLAVTLAGMRFVSTLARAQDAAPWRALFNGADLDGWETYLTKPDVAWDVPGLDRDAATGKYLEAFGANHDPLKVFTVAKVEGGPVVRISGQGFGAMTTKASFGNIHLRMQFKWGERTWGARLGMPRDSGLLYFVHGLPGFERETWPRSLEFQIHERETGDLRALGTQTTARALSETVSGETFRRYDPSGELTRFTASEAVGNRVVRRDDRAKPPGEWNTVELICFNGDSIHVVNGRVVLRTKGAQRLDALYGEPAPLVAGKIALQTNGAEVFFRGIEVREIAAVPAEFVEADAAAAK